MIAITERIARLRESDRVSTGLVSHSEQRLNDAMNIIEEQEALIAELEKSIGEVAETGLLPDGTAIETSVMLWLERLLLTITPAQE